MPGIEKRGDYKPRSQREKEAYRLVLFGSATGLVGAVTLLLTIVGVIGDAIPPIILLMLAAWSAWRFRRVTGQR